VFWCFCLLFFVVVLFSLLFIFLLLTNMDIRKFEHLLDSVIGQCVTIDGDTYKFCERIAGDKAKLKNGDNVRRVSMQQLWSGYAQHLANSDPLLLKQFAFDIYMRSCGYRGDVKTVKKEIRTAKQALGYKRKLLRQHKSMEAQKMPSKSNFSKSLRSDKHTLASLNIQIEGIEHRVKECSDALNNLLLVSDQYFASNVEAHRQICSLGVELKLSSLQGWMANGSAPKKKGRPVVIDKDAEEKLLEVVLYCDKMGFPLNQTRIIDLAFSVVSSSSAKGQFGTSGPTTSWFRGWYKRMRSVEPKLVDVIARGKDVATFKWYNSRNINWYFDSLKRILLSNGFARERTNSDTVAGEVILVTPERMIFTDETGVNDSKEKKRKEKVYTTTDDVESGTNQRRTLDCASDYGEHISMVNLFLF